MISAGDIERAFKRKGLKPLVVDLNGNIVIRLGDKDNGLHMVVVGNDDGTYYLDAAIVVDGIHHIPKTTEGMDTGSLTPVSLFDVLMDLSSEYTSHDVELTHGDKESVASFREYVEDKKKRVDQVFHPELDAILSRYTERMKDYRREVDSLSRKNDRASRRRLLELTDSRRDMETMRRLVDEVGRPDGPRTQSAADKLDAEISKLEMKNESWKRVNTALRKGRWSAVYRNLSPSEKRLYAKRENVGPLDVAEVSSQIKALKKRRSEITSGKRDALRTFHDGYTVTYDKEEGRIRIAFDYRPNDRILHLMHNKGFRWSPKHCAWQCKYTDLNIDRVETVIQQIERIDEGVF